MKYLQVYENSDEYAEAIEYNGYGPLPHASVLKDGDQLIPGYISDPIRTATYEGPTNLFYDNYNIKKVVAGDKVLYENNNEPVKHTITVTPENLVITGTDSDALENAEVIYCDDHIFLNPSEAQVIEISRNRTSTGTGIEKPGLHEYLAMVYDTNHVKDIYWDPKYHMYEHSTNEEVKYIIYCHSDYQTHGDKEVTFQWRRDGDALTTHITYYTIPLPYIEVFHESMQNDTPILPQNIKIDKVRIRTNVDTTVPGVYLVVKEDGYLVSVWGSETLDQFRTESPEYIDFPFPNEYNGRAIQIGFAQVVEDGLVDGSTPYLDNSITCYQVSDPADLYSENDITITYEPFNRFYPVHFGGTNVVSFNDKAHEYHFVSELHPAVYQNCSKIKELVIPEHIDTIPYQSLAGLTSLESLTLPKKLNVLHIQDLNECPNLKEIIFLGEEAPTLAGYVGIGGLFPHEGVIKAPMNGRGYSALVKEINMSTSSGLNWALEYF